MGAFPILQQSTLPAPAAPSGVPPARPSVRSGGPGGGQSPRKPREKPSAVEDLISAAVKPVAVDDFISAAMPAKATGPPLAVSPKREAFLDPRAERVHFL